MRVCGCICWWGPTDGVVDAGLDDVFRELGQGGGLYILLVHTDLHQAEAHSHTLTQTVTH